MRLRLLRRAQRCGLDASLQHAFERAFIIDDDVRPGNAKLGQRLSDDAFNRRAKLLLHNAVDFKLNTWLIP